MPTFYALVSFTNPKEEKPSTKNTASGRQERKLEDLYTDSGKHCSVSEKKGKGPTLAEFNSYRENDSTGEVTTS